MSRAPGAIRPESDTPRAPLLCQDRALRECDVVPGIELHPAASTASSSTTIRHASAWGTVSGDGRMTCPPQDVADYFA